VLTPPSSRCARCRQACANSPFYSLPYRFAFCFPSSFPFTITYQFRPRFFQVLDEVSLPPRYEIVEPRALVFSFFLQSGPLGSLSPPFSPFGEPFCSLKELRFFSTRKSSASRSKHDFFHSARIVRRLFLISIPLSRLSFFSFYRPG